MSLRLNVPALEDKPIMPAMTRPRQIQEMVAGLPTGNPRAAARVLLEELERLNRQPLATDQRVTALELFRPAIQEVIATLSRQFSHQPLPLQETARAQAEITQQLLTELAYGYKRAILSEDDRLFSMGDDNQLALLMQRAIETMARRLQVYYQTYTPIPDGIWSEMHLLYLHALKFSIQNLAIPDTLSDISINLTYKHALLLAIANPLHLNSLDIDRVIDYLDRYARLAQLHPLSTPDNKHGVFVVHLKADSPPIPLDKARQDTDARTDILLYAIELARQVHHHLTHLHERGASQSLNLPLAAEEDPGYRDMLLYLLKHWGTPPKRIFQRASKNTGIDICIGLEAVHYYLGNDHPPGKRHTTEERAEITIDVADSAIDSGHTKLFKSARWVVVNESAGGIALTKRADTPDTLRVGELVGLKPDDAEKWGLAVVRWAVNGADVPLQVGAQMIAPSATAVIIHATAGESPIAALLLPELISLKQPATLISPRGIYKPARTITLETHGHQEQIVLTRLVERSHTFERYQFSRL